MEYNRYQRNLIRKMAGVPARPLSLQNALRMAELYATDINYGRMAPAQGLFVAGECTVHRVRIMEPGTSRIHFVDCEVPV